MLDLVGGLVDGSVCFNDAFVLCGLVFLGLVSLLGLVVRVYCVICLLDVAGRLVSCEFVWVVLFGLCV